MLYVGIDWSQQKHDVCVCNQHGAVVTRLTIPHSLDGFVKLDRELAKIADTPQECCVGIETAYNVIVDYLVDRGYDVHIIAPRTTKVYRRRERASGAYDDQSDAELLAWILRVDQPLHPAWRANSPLTQQMAGQVRLIEQLRRAMQRLQGQLRAALLRTFPVALELFALDTQIGLRFLAVFPTHEEACQLSLDEFVGFLAECGYSRAGHTLSRYNRLHRPWAKASPDAVRAHRDQVVVLSEILLDLEQKRSQVISELTRLFRQHPDHDLFASLPGAGALLAPALQVKFGDDRQRFPDPSVVQALAGTCPVTERSGKKTIVHFRYACDHDFRRIVQQFAYCSIRSCGWASAYWHESYQRRGSRSHATRMVANRWLAIIWKMWQTSQPYDERYHLKQRAARSRPLV